MPKNCLKQQVSRLKKSFQKLNTALFWAYENLLHAKPSLLSTITRTEKWKMWSRQVVRNVENCPLNTDQVVPYAVPFLRRHETSCLWSLTQPLPCNSNTRCSTRSQNLSAWRPYWGASRRTAVDRSKWCASVFKGNILCAAYNIHNRWEWLQTNSLHNRLINTIRNN